MSEPSPAMPLVNILLQRFLSTTCLSAVLLAAASTAQANPVDGTVSSGSATITSNGTTLDITQSTNKAVIDWRGFDIAAGETTAFHQPNSSSVTLNRVNSSSASIIDGTLTANGNIFIVNQNGVLFGGGSRVDVNSLVVSTADISNANFNAGHYTFDAPGNANATIENRGQITAKEAGLVGLVAPNVINSGVITARLGRVHLASGDTATVDLYGDGLMEVAVSDAVTSQLVDNTGVITAEGGTIALTAAAGATMVNSLIHVGGELRAPAVGMRNGKIIIAAAGSNAVNGNVAANKGIKQGTSTVLVDGVLDVSGKNAGETGGSITITGDQITLASSAVIDASGTNGGGIVHVGGQYLGGGDTPTAITTIMQAGAVITASALVEGNGGEVIVYADERTTFDGRIEADGAGEHGEGGFIETSGKHVLLVNSGSVSATGRKRKGTWLLDPADITITTSTSNSSGSTPFTATGTASTIDVVLITTALNAGTNVTVQTSNDGFAGNGDITVASAISSTSGSLTGGATQSGDLTLSAYRNITVSAAITLYNGSLTLRSNNAGAADGSTGTGAISVAAAITTNGGNITMGGGSGAITGAILNADGTLNTAATGYAVGNSALNKGINITAAIDTGAGNLIMNGIGYTDTADYNYGININGNVTAGGTAQVSGIGGGAGVSMHNYGVLVSSAKTLQTTGSGTLTVYGHGGNETGSGQRQYGLSITGVIQTTGSGAVRVAGLGGNNSGSGIANFGILLNTNSSFIRGNGGDVVVYGVAGMSTGNANYGIDIYSGNITNNGVLTVIGVGGGVGNSSNNIGVHVEQAGGNITSSGAGLLTVIGTGGGAGSGSGNYGVNVSSTGGSINSTGGGAISVTGYGGNLAGTGGTNHGIIITNTNGIQSNGGAVTLKGVKGGQSDSYGLLVSAADGVKTTSSGNVAAYTDTIWLNTANNINAAGVLTLASYSNQGMSIGANVASTTNISTTYLGYITGASYVFGSTTTATGAANTGDVTVNTTNDFGTKDVTFISGNDMNVAGTLTKATGAGTANYLLQANRDIYNSSSAGITATTGAINLTFDADYDQATVLGGRINISSGTISSNGGNITLSGGSNVATGYAQGRVGAIEGIQITSATIDAGAGTLTVRGAGYSDTATSSAFGVVVKSAGKLQASGGNTVSVTGLSGIGLNSNYGVIVDGANSFIRNTGTGAVTIAATSRSTGSGTDNNGMRVQQGGAITSNSGAISITALGSTSGTGITGDFGIYLYNSGTITSTSGQINITGLGGNNVSGIRSGTGTNTINAGSGAITFITDVLSLSNAAVQTSSVFTIKSYTNRNFEIGNYVFANSKLQVLEATLAQLSAGSYVFGGTTLVDGIAANTSDVSINTAYDFGTKDVTFLSGNDITVSGALTRVAGGTGSLSFKANRNISVNGAITTQTGNVLLQSDFDGDGGAGNGGAIYTGATITTNGGNITMGGGSGTITAAILNADGTVNTAATGYAVGNVSNGVYINSTINAGGGNIIMNGIGANTATDFAAGVNLDIGTVTTTGSGTIKFSGTGGAGAGSYHRGVRIVNGSAVTTVDGAIEIVGVGAGNGSDNYGIYITTGSAKVQATGNGAVKVNGTGSDSTGARNHGVFVSTSGFISAADNSLIVIGTGGGTGISANNYGVVVSTASSTIKTTGTGALNITGTGGNASGSGGSNFGIYSAVANGIQTTGSGSMTLTGTKGGQSSSHGIFSDAANEYITTGSGNITLLTDSIYLNAAYNVNSIGSLTIAPKTTGTMAVGTTGSTLNLSNTDLSYLTAASYIFGSVNAGDVTINTTNDFGTKDVTFISGNDMNVAGALTRVAGGTGSLSFKANRNISINSAITTQTGSVLLQSDFDGDSGAGNGGAIYVAPAASITTNGGAITIGGGSGTVSAGSGYAVGNSGRKNGIYVNTATLNAGGGTIILNGQGWASATSFNDSLGIKSLATTISTTGTGSIWLNGIGGGLGTTTYDSAIQIDSGSSITSANGDINFTGRVTETGNGAAAFSFGNGSNVQTSGTGSINFTDTGTNGGGFSGFGTTNAITSNNNITYSGYAFSAGTTVWTWNAANTITVKAYTPGTTMAVGTTGSILNLSNTHLGNMTAASYIFGSTTTGDVTINTTKDFADKNVSFISGNDIIITGSVLTKSTGTGTANYLFQANRDIYSANNSGWGGVNATSGKINMTFNSDYDQATVLGGSIAWNGSTTLNSNGGNIVMGGGTDPTTGYATSLTGTGVYFYSTSISSGAGNITIHGKSSALTGANMFGYYSGGGTLSSTTGDIKIYGIGSSTGTESYGVFMQNAGAKIITDTGSIILTGTGGPSSGLSGAGVLLRSSASITSNGTGGSVGAITLIGTGGASAAGVGIINSASISSQDADIVLNSLGGTSTSIYGSSTIQTNGSAGKGNFTVIADGFYTPSASTISATGTITIKPNANATTMGIGPSSGSVLNVTNAALGYMSGGAYIFGSTTTGDLTINTTKDFGTANVTFLSGGNISLAGTLTKATGAGTATYLLQANGNISNSSSAGISATTGAINLTLESDHDVSGAGAITLASAPLTVNDGTITLTSNGQSVTQSGSIGGDETITSGNGAVSIGALDGDTAGTRSLTVNAGTATFTTTGAIGGSTKLNNLTVSADDVILGANVSGTGTLTLQPTSTNRIVKINNGTADGTNFNLSTAEIGYLVDGWSGINIGKSASSVDLYIGDSSWVDPVTFRSNYRKTIYALMGTGNASFTFSGGGWIDLFNDITTAGGTVNASGVNYLYINNVSSTKTIATSGGAVTLNNLNINNTAGSLMVNSGGGNITVTSIFSAAGTATSAVTLNAGTGNADITGTSNGGANLIATGATITLGGAIGGTTPLGNVTLTSTNSISLPAITTAAGKTVSVSVTGAGNSITTTGAIATGTLGNITLTADDLILGGNLSGTGTLSLRQTTLDRILNINYGVADGSNLNLSTTELGYFVDDWGTITLGSSTVGGAVNLGNSTWTDPVRFQTKSGAVSTAVYGTLTGSTADASITTGTLNLTSGSSIVSIGPGVTVNGNLSTQSASVTTNGGVFTVNNQTFLSGSGTGFTVNTGGGNIRLCYGGGGGCSTNSSFTGGAAGQTISLDAGTGSITYYGKVDGAYNLTNTAGTMTFVNPWGNTTPLGAVSLTSTNALTLPSITASSIFARTTGAAADITIASGKTLTASGAGNAITLASGRNFINSAATPFSLTGGGRWLVYSTNPAADTLNSLTSGFVRYGCSYGGSCPTGVTIPGTGNGLVYTYQPTLTVTPTALAALTYGDAVPSLTGYAYGVTGYLTSAAGNDSAADTLGGSLTGSTTYTPTSNVANYNINYASGTLTSALGYAFTYANNATAFSVGQKALTATANSQTITEGASVPTTTVTYTGFVNGETSSVIDTLASIASVQSGTPVAGSYVGNYTASGAADVNYSFSYVAGDLTVNAAGGGGGGGGTTDPITTLPSTVEYSSWVPLLLASLSPDSNFTPPSGSIYVIGDGTHSGTGGKSAPHSGENGDDADTTHSDEDARIDDPANDTRVTIEISPALAARLNLNAHDLAVIQGI